MKKQAKTGWVRVRPGLYKRSEETFYAEVERGAETGRWWFKAVGAGSSDFTAGRCVTLSAAKQCADAAGARYRLGRKRR